jgi:hypothetical protein
VNAEKKKKQSTQRIYTILKKGREKADVFWGRKVVLMVAFM